MTKKLATLAAAALLALSTVAVSFDAAEAARMGGGRSFGSRPGYSQPAQRQQTQNMNQNRPGQQQQQQNVGQAAPRPGGMFGGLMGGLLAGTLLGALFMGMPFGGAGMLDMLLIGLVLFLVFRFVMSRRRASEAQAVAGAGAGVQRNAQADSGQWSGGSQWDRLSSASAGQGQAAQAGPQPGEGVPGFDAEEFLRGAKMVYTRLQASWDSRDLDDIREFATPEVYEEIARQATEDPTPSRTEILMVNARVLEAKQDGGHVVATVYYDVLMREDQAQDAPTQVREVWHFRRESADPESSWKLEGIQQLEN